ncbi:hypothetical protein [Mesorhizobium sp. B3-1-9]|uniref:DUF6998 domain-containing protein n=1 Tax=Mesorhizobium sp. B3-1-9 TaxID=2589892 RepID=UPI001FEF8D4F|nr:hypothetical protein [Mesorhizobium sp. B3-1-9]
MAAEALGLTLYPGSHPGHDAFDLNGDVQIKMTGGKSVALYGTCTRLVVLRVISPEFAEIVYDGPGEPAWQSAGKIQKNGQRTVRLSKLQAIAKHRTGTPETTETIAIQVEDGLRIVAASE